MSNALDLHTARMLAEPGLALILAAPALAVGLCLWPPYRRAPILITGAHLLLCGLMLTTTEIALIAQPGSWLMLSWCIALVVMAYLTAGLRLLDYLLSEPAVAAVLTSVQENAKALIVSFRGSGGKVPRE